MPDRQALVNFARRRAKRYGLNPDVFVAQINQESGFQTGRTSPAGAQGVAQITPDTAKGWGVDPNRPRQALDAAAMHMAQYVKQYGSVENALRAYNAGPGNIRASHGFGETNAYVASILGSARSSGGKVDTTGQAQTQKDTTVNSLLKFGQDKLIDKQTFDKAAFEQARKRALVGAFISKRRPGSVLAEVLPTQTPDPRDFIQTSSVFKPGKFGIDNQKQTTITPAAGVPKTSGKVKVFDGKPVVAAFIPELQWARQHGWTGTVTSGVRTKAQQLAAAKNFGLQHYGPKGPLGSNHVVGHQGAVDVSEPDQLDAILRHYPGKRRLRRGMADDPVHFSPTGH